MTISVIVPNYNGIEILRNCLVSLQEHDRKPEQIIVVDNGSSDGSVETIRKDFPDVTLISLKNNTGFTGANNAGITAASGDLLVLLNNDCIVEPGWLSNLEKRMDDPSTGAVTSSIRNINDVNTMDSAGGEIDWMGFSRDIGKGEPASHFTEQMDLAFPCGGAVMVRRSALPNSSKLFWDKLFIYQEDLDLGFELNRTGWRIVYEPTAVVRHMHSATSGRGSYFKEHLCTRNRILVLRKHLDPKTFAELAPVIRKWHNLWFLASVFRGRFTLARAVLKGTEDGFAMPVETFTAAIPAEDIFTRFAVSNKTKHTKQTLYEKAETIIRRGGQRIAASSLKPSSAHR